MVNMNMPSYHHPLYPTSRTKSTTPPRPTWSILPFFDDSLVQMIVDETNRYVEQVLQGTDKVWSTTNEEIRAYMGFMILMGINHLPKIRDYWSVSKYFGYTPKRGSHDICFEDKLLVCVLPSLQIQH